MRNKIKMSLVVVSLLSTSLLAIEITSVSESVDIAGKQRMFTQRMLKDYSMIGMGNKFGNPSEDLKKISIEFQDNLDSLKHYAKSSDVKESLDKVSKLWKPIKVTLSKSPTKDKVEKLQTDLDKLLKESDIVTQLLAKESGKTSAKIVNKAGRQRMLSQRMASLYMLKVWGVNDPQFKQKLDDSMKLFKVSLDDLTKSDLNNDEINGLLSKVKRSFIFFEMMSRSKSKFIPTLIYKKSNDILANMNKATDKYVNLEAK